MAHKPLDTLEIYQKYRNTGIPHAAAEAMCKAHKEMHDGYYSQFVTKDELENIVIRIFWKQILGAAVIIGCIVAIWTLSDQLNHHSAADTKPHSTLRR